MIYFTPVTCFSHKLFISKSGFPCQGLSQLQLSGVSALSMEGEKNQVPNSNYKDDNDLKLQLSISSEKRKMACVCLQYQIATAQLYCHQKRMHFPRTDCVCEQKKVNISFSHLQLIYCKDRVSTENLCWAFIFYRSLKELSSILVLGYNFRSGRRESDQWIS